MSRAGQLRPDLPETVLLAVVIGIVAGAAIVGGNETGGVRSGERTQKAQAVKAEKLKRRLERIRKLKFKKPIKTIYMSKREAAALGRRMVAREYSKRRQYLDEDALKLVGLLKPKVNLRVITSEVIGEQTLGFYDPEKRRIVVIKGRHRSEPLLEVVLSHEFTHALEDQHFGFQPLDTEVADDQATAISALQEGTAMRVMTEYIQRHVGIGSALSIGMSALGEIPPNLPPYVQMTLEFPYTYGERFVGELYEKAGGWRLVDNALSKRPPDTTQQVIQPDKYLAGVKARRIPSPPIRQELGRKWRRLLETSVGELDTFAILKLLAREDEREAGEMAAAWSGGKLWLWRRRGSRFEDCRAPCVSKDVGVLKLTWGSRGDARRFAAAVPDWIERGLEGARVVYRTGAGMWKSRSGAVAMSVAGRLVTVVFAPNESLAAELAMAR